MKFMFVSESFFMAGVLFLVKLIVYSKSKFLAIVFVSLFGVIQGSIRVPKNRINAFKRLLNYGVEVLQHGF